MRRLNSSIDLHATDSVNLPSHWGYGQPRVTTTPLRKALRTVPAAMAAATSFEYRSAPVSFLTQPLKGTTPCTAPRTAPTAASPTAVDPRSIRPGFDAEAGASRSGPRTSSSARTSAASAVQL